MNAVQTWSLSVCFSVLAISLLRYFVPRGSMERMIRFVTGTFLVCSILFPLRDILPRLPDLFQLSAHTEEYTDFSSFVEEQESRAVEDSIQNLVKTELKEMGISCKNIRVDMDIAENGSIGINRIQVELDPGYEGYGMLVRSELTERLGVEVEVAHEGNGQG